MSSALDEFKKPIEDWASALVDGSELKKYAVVEHNVIIGSTDA
jgi:hypothetical protein